MKTSTANVVAGWGYTSEGSDRLYSARWISTPLRAAMTVP